MKKILLALIVLLPISIFGQRELTLKVKQVYKSTIPTVNDFDEEGAEWLYTGTTPPTTYKLMDATASVTSTNLYNNLAVGDGGSINASSVKRGQTFTTGATELTLLDFQARMSLISGSPSQVTFYIFAGNQTAVDPAVGTALFTSNPITISNAVSANVTVVPIWITTPVFSANTQYTWMVVRTGGAGSIGVILSGNADDFAGQVSSIGGAQDYKFQMTFGVGAGTNAWVRLQDLANVTGGIPKSDEINAAANQTSFTLTSTPKGTVIAYINGVMIPKAAYTISGTSITYVPAQNDNYALLAGDRVNFTY